MSPRQKVLIFAYACDPKKGSEPGAGAVLAQTAALVADEVVVLTRHEPGLRAAQLASELGSNVKVIQCGPARSRLPTYVKYLWWVISAAKAASKLRRQAKYDVLHHATYASDWFFNPLTFVPKKSHERWVWGPAGGASYAPYAAARIVTHSSAFSEVARQLVTTTMRKLILKTLRKRVDIAIALNHDSESAFADAGIPHTAVSSNAVLDYDSLPQANATAKTVTFAGRGVPWKGLPLLIEAFSQLPEDWQLYIAGPETDVHRYRELSQHLGRRVTFFGSLDRTSALKLVSTSTVLALPSLHDSAPWAAAEAAGMGVPVVCFDIGGVSSMAGPLAISVKIEPSDSLVERFSQAIMAAQDSDRKPHKLHSRAHLMEVLKSAYTVGNLS